MSSVPQAALDGHTREGTDGAGKTRMPGTKYLHLDTTAPGLLIDNEIRPICLVRYVPHCSIRALNMDFSQTRRTLRGVTAT